MEFNALEFLESVVGYKGLPFPGAWYGAKTARESLNESLKQSSNKGTNIYKKDFQGNYYFMPVTFRHKGKEYEIDCALITIAGKKNIIETPLVGRQGAVKELISIDDYQIDISGLVIGFDKEWPEEKIEAINELYTINEAIELKCALTDIFFDKDDKVVIKELKLPSAKQTEHVQVVEIKCVTDRAFELIIGG